jgi:hypothetical protein
VVVVAHLPYQAVVVVVVVDRLPYRVVVVVVEERL